MNDSSEDPKTESDPLQFDRVEPAGAATATATPQSSATCFSCSRAIDQYFELNGKVVCDNCRASLLHHFTGPIGFRRFAGIALKGAGAAALGSVLYYAVRTITGYELGLIAIVVGYLVGTTVRKGSNSRGGWKMQALAMSLTYLAIVSTYIPSVVQQLVKLSQKDQPAATTPLNAGAPGTPATATDDLTGNLSGTPTIADYPAAAPATTAKAPANLFQTVGAFFMLGGIVLALSMAMPFLLGFDNLMGLLIIAIALYEAWKLNKRPTLAVTGPFRVSAPTQAALL